jgi:predicted phage terminase large subunit-like protein
MIWSAHVLEQEGWDVVRLPAIAEMDEIHEVETIFGRRSFARRQGEALQPGREPLDTLDRIRRTIGEYNFAGQYQQSPAPLGGGLVKADWFRRYNDKNLPETFDRIVQSWDTANKANELSDFSVCTTWGIKAKDLFLIGLFRRRLEYPDLKRAVREQQYFYNANVVLIEDKASGTQLIQELIADRCHGVTRYQPTTDKIMRLHAQTALIENGFVSIPESAPWLDECSYNYPLVVPATPPGQPQAGECRTEQRQGSRFGNTWRRGRAAIGGKPGDEGPTTAGTRSVTRKGVDRRIEPVSSQHRRIRGPQTRRVGDLKADRVSGIGIAVEEIKAKVENRKAVHLTGSVVEKLRRIERTRRAHRTEGVGPVDIEVSGPAIAHQKRHPVGGQRGKDDIGGVGIDRGDRDRCVRRRQSVKCIVWSADELGESGMGRSSQDERQCRSQRG